MAGILKNLQSLGTLRLSILGGAAALLIGIFVLMTGQLSSPDMALLYSDLELSDSAEIVAKLEAEQVPYTVQAGGATLMVPRDQVDRLRVQFAGQGLPKGGSLGYEIFDQGEGLGATSFIQNINRLRALEGELARTIGTIGGIRQARVHLVLPERELFSREQVPPSASVFLRLAGAGVDSQQIRAIQHLVAAAVPRLQPSAISIVDDQGNLLADGPRAEDGSAALVNAEQMRTTYERQLTQRIEDLVSRTVGAGKVRAQVSVDMDFDRVTRSAETYDPDGQVARSTQMVEDNSTNQDSSTNQPVSVGQNLPAAAAQDQGSSSLNQSRRTEETINYEINRVVENTVREPGSVRRLSIAVLVDGLYTPNASGAPVYTPRPAEELASIQSIVSSAVGFDANRGDVIEVVNLPFASVDQGEAAADPASLLGLDRSDIMQLVQVLVLGVVAGLVLLLVIRPLLRRAVAGVPAALPTDLVTAGLLTDQSQQSAAAAALPGADTAAPQLNGPSRDAEEMISLAQVEGKVRASATRKVAELIDERPDAAANVIKQWLYQEG